MFRKRALTISQKLKQIYAFQLAHIVVLEHTYLITNYIKRHIRRTYQTPACEIHFTCLIELRLPAFRVGQSGSVEHIFALRLYFKYSVQTMLRIQRKRGIMRKFDVLQFRRKDFEGRTAKALPWKFAKVLETQ